MRINLSISMLLVLMATGCFTNVNDHNVDKAIVDANRLTLQSYIDKNPEIIKRSVNEREVPYLSDDLEILQNLINKIPAIEPKYDEFAKVLPGFQGRDYHLPEKSGSTNTGFELQVSNDIYYGGAGNFLISILHHNNEVLFVNINMYFGYHLHDYIRDKMVEYIGFPIKCHSYGVYYSRIFQENVDKYNSKNIFPLRLKPTSEKYSSEDLAYYETLSNPANSLSWGYSCGVSGGPTKGAIAIDSLVQAGHYELIEDILYSANIVGRVYAMQALSRANKDGLWSLSEQTKQVLSQVRELNVPYRICDSGCVSDMMSYKEWLASVLPPEVFERIENNYRQHLLSK